MSNFDIMTSPFYSIVGELEWCSCQKWCETVNQNIFLFSPWIPNNYLISEYHHFPKNGENFEEGKLWHKMKAESVPMKKNIVMERPSRKNLLLPLLRNLWRILTSHVTFITVITIHTGNSPSWSSHLSYFFVCNFVHKKFDILLGSFTYQACVTL